MSCNVDKNFIPKDENQNEGYCAHPDCNKVVPNIRNHHIATHLNRNTSCPFNCGIKPVADVHKLKIHIRCQHADKIGYYEPPSNVTVEYSIKGLASPECLLDKLKEFGQDVSADIQQRHGFVFKYNRDTKMPDFVFYRLTLDMFAGKNGHNRTPFHHDENLNEEQLNHHIFSYEGLHHGHLVPHASFKNNPAVIEDASKYSVLVPMVESFNGGVLFALEEHTRELLKTYGHKVLYVMIGPVTKGSTKRKTIGWTDFTFPSHIFVVLVLETHCGKTLIQSFLLNHVKYGQHYFHEMCQIEDIEQHLDFHIFPSLIREYQWEQGVKTFFCYQCMKPFSFEDYITHKSQHHLDFFCTFSGCHKKFDSRMELKKHRDKQHIPPPNFKCNLCNKTFAYKANLNNHIRHNHQKVKDFKCTECDKIYYAPESLRVHVLKKHAPPQERFYCKACDKNLLNIGCFMDHMVEHSDIRQLFCTYPNCKDTYGFFNRKIIFRHFDKMHKIRDTDQRESLIETRPAMPEELYCDICDLGFDTIVALGVHRCEHVEPCEYYCNQDICSNHPGFLTRKSCWKHLKKFHHISVNQISEMIIFRPRPSTLERQRELAAIPREYECLFEDCNANFPSESGFKAHIVRVHGIERSLAEVYLNCLHADENRAKLINLEDPMRDKIKNKVHTTEQSKRQYASTSKSFQPDSSDDPIQDTIKNKVQTTEQSKCQYASISKSSQPDSSDDAIQDTIKNKVQTTEQSKCQYASTSKSSQPDFSDDEDFKPPPQKKIRQSSPSTESKECQSQDTKDNNSSVKEAEKPKESSSASRRYVGYRKHLARLAAEKLMSTTPDLPSGGPGCLQGCSFVITGTLKSATRWQLTDYINFYEGQVKSAVSKKTSYLIVGENPGEKKVHDAIKYGIKTFSEMKLYALIQGSGAKVMVERL